MESDGKGGYPSRWIRVSRGSLTVVKKIVTSVILGIVGLAVVVAVTLLSVSDDLVKRTTGAAAGPLLGAKHGVADWIGDLFHGTAHGSCQRLVFLPS